MKKYVNGYDKFRIRTVNSSGTETIHDFSFKYQALREYYEKISTTDVFTDGSREKKVHYLEYEFRIFYTQGIESPDLLRFGYIEEAENRGDRIHIVPHIDYPWREFEVIILDEKRTIDTMPHGRGKDSTINSGYEISFINKYPITNIQMADPNYIPVISAMAYCEF